MRVVVGITGASGAVYAVRLVEVLSALGHEVLLIISENGARVLEYETGLKRVEIEKRVKRAYTNTDLFSDISSGSCRFDACVIVPCSANTLAKISHGIADNLITRTASVCLKEARKLVLVPRETPLSKVQIESMLKVADAGAVVLPAMPGFYGKPKTVQELVDFVVGKILDVLGIENEIYRRWRGRKRKGLR
ncbi:MAG: UbiX family flavin prenyltransferase [Thermoplasmata archaeon]|nr:UbiX family flavin prenyltransferase [Thermoplasmata archaeon]